MADAFCIPCPLSFRAPVMRSAWTGGYIEFTEGRLFRLTYQGQPAQSKPSDGSQVSTVPPPTHVPRRGPGLMHLAHAVRRLDAPPNEAW